MTQPNHKELILNESTQGMDKYLFEAVSKGNHLKRET